MNNQPYDYSTRKGVLPISWQDFHSICRGLALAASRFDPGIVLGIARGGLYPGTLISHLLQSEFYPIRLTRRYQDKVVREHPEWVLRPPEGVRGERVLLIDEISSTGETLRTAKDELLRLGAAEVHCAVMYAHTWGAETPDYIGIISDELIINPWDREVIKEGQIIPNAEYMQALATQNIPPESVLPMPGVEIAHLAKIKI